MRRLSSVVLVALGVGACHADKESARPSAPPPRVAAPVALALDAGAGPWPDEADDALCSLPPVPSVSIPSATPYRLSEVKACDGMCDSVERPLHPADTCVVAASNLSRAIRESHETGAPGGSSVAATLSAPWSRDTQPLYLDRIDAHVHLTAPERAKLQANGFVVLDRLDYASYANAFHEVFQEQLPLFVSADAAMHAVFRGDELVLERLERKELLPALHSMLTKLRAGLRAARPRLAPDTVHDLDVYLGVAAALADEHRADGNSDARTPRRSLFGHDGEVEALLGRVDGHTMTDPDAGIVLFGRARVVDFSMYEPRGHYVASWSPEAGASLAGYFQSVTWLSRLELNLVSRSCRSSQPGAAPDPSETPREARMALALAEIARDSGAVSEVGRFDRLYRAFAGTREDVSIEDLVALEQKGHLRASDPAAPAALKSLIGDSFPRTARTHFMPAGSTTLPAITTLLGERVVPDIAPLTRLVEDSVAGRTVLGAADVGYLLGHDRARAYLRDDLARYPELAANLDTARAELRAASRGPDVYSGWLRTVLAVAAPPEGVVPSFVRTAAYQDRRLDSALVGFGQIRHAFTLLAAQGYDSYGCEIPDAYVEPALPQWGSAGRPRAPGAGGRRRLRRSRAQLAHAA